MLENVSFKGLHTFSTLKNYRCEFFFKGNEINLIFRKRSYRISRKSLLKNFWYREILKNTIIIYACV